jgi:hypothetical protein
MMNINIYEMEKRERMRKSRQICIVQHCAYIYRSAIIFDNDLGLQHHIFIQNFTLQTDMKKPKILCTIPQGRYSAN